MNYKKRREAPQSIYSDGSMTLDILQSTLASVVYELYHIWVSKTSVGN